MARLDLAEGHAASAESVARESEEVFRTESAVDWQALSQVVLTDALLLQHRLAEANSATAQAQSLADQSRDRRARWGAARTAALLRASAGSAADPTVAIQALGTAAAEAAHAGYVGVNLELRVAAGQVEKATGRHRAARVRSELVAKEAAAKGFGLLARQATAILR